jgi:hypothetical protein
MDAKMHLVKTPKAVKPRKFTCFQLLAPEIRIKIWALALPGPRIVDVHYDHTTNGFFELSKPVETHLIHVNKEAREEVFKCYSAWFGTEIQHPLIYASMRIDIIKLNFDAFRYWKVTDQEYFNIQHLEITGPQIYKVGTISLVVRLGLMPNLKQFIVVDPRSPFIMRPFPTFPTIYTAGNLYKYYVARGEFYIGLALEEQCVKIWDRLVEVDNAARLSLYRLSNFTTGMVGITADGQRRYRIVGYEDHNKA